MINEGEAHVDPNFNLDSVAELKLSILKKIHTDLTNEKSETLLKGFTLVFTDSSYEKISWSELKYKNYLITVDNSASITINVYKKFLGFPYDWETINFEELTTNEMYIDILKIITKLIEIYRKERSERQLQFLTKKYKNIKSRL